MDQVAKVNITTEADSAADEMHAALNDGFESGKVSKTELLSWVILFFRKSSFEKFKDKIRSDHFDDVAHLESVIRELKEARKQARDVDVAKLLAPVTARVKEHPLPKSNKTPPKTA